MSHLLLLLSSLPGIVTCIFLGINQRGEASSLSRENRGSGKQVDSCLLLSISGCKIVKCEQSSELIAA